MNDNQAPIQRCLTCGNPCDSVEKPCEHCQQQWQHMFTYMSKAYKLLTLLENSSYRLQTVDKPSTHMPLAHANPPVRFTVIDLLARIRRHAHGTIHHINDSNLTQDCAMLPLEGRLERLAHTSMTWVTVADWYEWKEIMALTKHMLTVNEPTYPCLNPMCHTRIRVPNEDTTTVTCPNCHSIWQLKALTDNVHTQLLRANTYTSSSQAEKLLATIGINVKASTIRTWASLGHVTRTEKGYKLSDIYMKATLNQ